MHKFKHEHEKEYSVHVVGAVGPLTMSCMETQTVTNNKADAKSPPPVILTAIRRQSFSCPKSTSSRQSVIFFSDQSVTFLYVTDSGDYTEVHDKKITKCDRLSKIPTFRK